MRTYMKGRPLSPDFGASIIDEILRNGDNIHTGYFPGRLKDAAKRFKVRIWKLRRKRMSRERTIEPRRHGRGNHTILNQGDL